MLASNGESLTHLCNKAHLEQTVLGALRDNLMDQQMLEAFCKEYMKECNRMKAAAEQGRSALERELAGLKRDHARLVDAIVAGIPADHVKDKLQSLSERETQLEAELSRAPQADPVRFHPRMAEAYQARVSELIMRLGDGDPHREAQEALRGLVDRIVLTPSEENHRLDIVLEGALSGLLALSLRERATNPNQVVDNVDELMLVAGVGFEPTTFRL